MKSSVFEPICRVSVVLSISFFAYVVPVAAQDLSERVSDSLEQIELGAHEVDISTNGGTVNLSGWVSSAADKEVLVQAVEKVNGVEKIIDSLAIDSSATKSIDDAELAEARIAEVKSATEKYLKALPVRGPYSLQYDFTQEGIVIKGELPPGVEKQALTYQLKRQVSTPIVDQILVRPWPSDAELLKRVRAQVGSKQGVNLEGISIAVKEGVVTLAGKRATHEEADQLAAAVLMVEGVRDIKSEIKF